MMNSKNVFAKNPDNFEIKPIDNEFQEKRGITKNILKNKILDMNVTPNLKNVTPKCNNFVADLSERFR
jgi:hypothetical protein